MYVLKKISILATIIFGGFNVQSAQAESFTFQEAVKLLQEHPYVVSEREASTALQHRARSQSSSGDPMLMGEVREVPLDSLSFSEMERTEMMIGISKRFSLSGRTRALHRSYMHQSESRLLSSQDRFRQLLSDFYGLLIERESLVARERIISQNFNWVQDMLRVTEGLYSRGNVGQQAIFDLKIRIADLEAELYTARVQLGRNQNEFRYLFEKPVATETLDRWLESINWDEVNIVLASDDDSSLENDPRLQVYQKQKKSSDEMASARRRARIPDPTIGVNYMKMKNMMGENDFVGLTVSFPIPVTTRTHSDLRESRHTLNSAQAQLRQFKLKREREIAQTKERINSLENELRVLESNSMNYAQSSREITARAYQRGSATYSELQSSEERLLNLQLRRERILEQLRRQKVQMLYLRGEDLNFNG